MQAKLVRALTMLYEIAAYPKDGAEDVAPAPGSQAAEARALIESL